MSISLGDALLYLGVNPDGLKDGLDSARRAAEGWTSSVGGMLRTGLAVGLAAGGAAVVAAVGKIGKEMYDVASDSRTALQNVRSEFGLTAAEADRLRGVGVAVFGNNFAGSIDEATRAVGQVRQQLGDLSDTELQRATENAFRLSDAFKIETAESVSTVRTLMENFGMTADQAFDFVAAGYQRGLNRSDDFLDSVNEYAVQFSNGGASAAEFFSVMETGLQGGMLGTDKVADAFKEFRVRILDGTATTSDALAQLGFDSASFLQQLASGQITVADAFGQVVGKLNETEDQAILMQAGVGLIGTQFEDLGQSAFEGLDLAKTGMEDLAGSADLVDERYKTLGAMWEGFKRKTLVELEPVGQVLLDLGAEIMPTVLDAIGSFADKAGPWIAGVADKVREMLPAIQEALSGFLAFTGKMLDYGRNISESLALGLVQGASAVVTALTAIGNIISYWLKPGSPPKLLPDLDKWGQEAANVYLQGWELANFEPVTALAEGIRDRLKTAILEAVEAERDLTEAQKDLTTETGRFDALLDGLRGGLSDIDGNLRRLRASQDMALRPLLANLAEIEGKVRDARREFERGIAPLDDELEAIEQRREEIERQQRLEEISKELKDESLEASERELLLLEQRRLQLEGQRDARQAEFDKAQEALEAERDAAGEKVDAMRSAQAAEEQALQDRRTAIELQILAAEKLRDDTIKPLEEAVALAERRLELARQEVTASKDAADAVRDQFKAVEEAGGGVGAAVAAGIEEAVAGVGEDLGDGLGETLGDGIGEGISKGIDEAKGKLDEELNKLQGKLDDLKKSWENIIASIAGLVGENGQQILDWVIGVGVALGTWTVLTSVVSAVGALKAAWVGLQAALAAGQGIAAIVALLGGPVTLALAAVAALVGLLAVAWRQNWGDIQGKTEAAWTAIKGVLETLRRVWVEEVWPAISEAAQKAWDKIQPHLEALRTWIVETVIPALQELYRKWVEEIWPAIQRALENAWIVISTIFGELQRWVNDNLLPIAQALREKWDEVWTAIAAKLTEIWDETVRPILEPLLAWFQEKAPIAIEALKTAWGVAWDIIGTKLSNIYDTTIKPVFDAIERFWNWLSGVDFSFDFKLPDLPDWLIPGSPIPLHTAWKNFADWLRSSEFELPHVERGAHALAGVATQVLPAGGGVSNRYDITINGGGGRELVDPLEHILWKLQAVGA